MASWFFGCNKVTSKDDSASYLPDKFKAQKTASGHICDLIRECEDLIKKIKAINSNEPGQQVLNDLYGKLKKLNSIAKDMGAYNSSVADQLTCNRLDTFEGQAIAVEGKVMEMASYAEMPAPHEDTNSRDQGHKSLPRLIRDVIGYCEQANSEKSSTAELSKRISAFILHVTKLLKSVLRLDTSVRLLDLEERMNTLESSMNGILQWKAELERKHADTQHSCLKDDHQLQLEAVAENIKVVEKRLEDRLSVIEMRESDQDKIENTPSQEDGSYRFVELFTDTNECSPLYIIKTLMGNTTDEASMQLAILVKDTYECCTSHLLQHMFDLLSKLFKPLEHQHERNKLRDTMNRVAKAYKILIQLIDKERIYKETRKVCGANLDANVFDQVFNVVWDLFRVDPKPMIIALPDRLLKPNIKVTRPILYYHYGGLICNKHQDVVVSRFQDDV